MNVWILNHYATGMYVDHAGRHYSFAKYLKRAGYNPTIFCSTTLHGRGGSVFSTDKTMVIKRAEKIDVPFVFIKAREYVGNGKNRALNMLDFYRNIGRCARVYAKHYGKPDIILASSVHPLTLLAGIKLARHFGVRCICEIRDLWPESLVTYGLIGRNHPLTRLLYRIEKKAFRGCDALITTFEGGYGYIEEMGYEKLIPRDRYYYINNGIDLEVYDKEKVEDTVDDADLDDADVFKIIYTGSIGLANGIEQLLGCARELKCHKDIRFLIYGGGTIEGEISKRIEKDGLDNVCFKGRVDKKYIPYILSKGDMCVLNFNKEAADAGLYRFGSSQNKLFEYLASGKPILSDTLIDYDIIDRYGCGISKTIRDDKSYAEAVLEIYNASDQRYNEMCDRAREASLDFDFKKLTDKLIEIIKETDDKGR